MSEEVVRTKQLLIRFRGICALLDFEKSKRKRAVLLRHRNGDAGIEHHIPHIEFYADDVKSFSSDLPIRMYTRPAFDGQLARVDLEDATEIRLKNPNLLVAGDVEEEANYRFDVAHMSEVLGASAANAKVVPSLLDPDVSKVDRDRAAAIFDMPKGRIMGGEPEAMITHFEKKVKFEERRLARWTDLLIDCPPPITLELHSLTTGTTREIVFRDTLRMLTIGNEPERAILGILTSDTGMHGVNHTHAGDPAAAPVQPTGHYILYYDLLLNPPKERPVPIPTQSLTPGCPPNGYP